MSGFLGFLRGTLRFLVVVTGALVLTVCVFLVLPVIQAIAGARKQDNIIETVEASALPPPPPPPQDDEPPPEEEPEPEEPQMADELQQLDLSQLELALNPGFGGGFGDAGTFGMELNVIGGAGKDGAEDGLFSLAELDQKPRVIYQPGPLLNAKLRRKAPGTVYVLFIVNERGRVEQPRVQSSSDPIFERPAINAVKQWKFEPGKREGKPVRFRMRVPVKFPKSQS